MSRREQEHKHHSRRKTVRNQEHKPCVVRGDVPVEEAHQLSIHAQPRNHFRKKVLICSLMPWWASKPITNVSTKALRKLMSTMRYWAWIECFLSYINGSSEYMVHGAATVLGFETFDGALGSVHWSISQHWRLELQHHLVDEAQLDDEERQELQLMIQNMTIHVTMLAVCKIHVYTSIMWAII
jgi:hypothetical protein